MEKSIITLLMRERESLYNRIFTGESVGRTIAGLLVISMLFFGLYGFTMGIYNSLLQSFSSMMKVPALFFLALLICYPAMFVFNILLGSKLNLRKSLAMILSAYALSACVLASFAPIALFFMLIGSSYPFLRLLHVAIFAVAGFAGMYALNGGLKYACEKHSIYPRQGVRVFKVWVIIFAFVGTQLAWNLRPFLGSRDLPFQLFRKQESNFYAHILHTTWQFVFGSKAPELPQTRAIRNDSNLPSDSAAIMQPIRLSPDKRGTGRQDAGR